MNILVAPNSMKNSLSASMFADCIEKGFTDVSPQFFHIKKLPLADGGDGTLDVLCDLFNLKIIKVNVSNPMGHMVTSRYGYNGKTAVIEMAEASGLKLLGKNELNPLKTSSYGTGQLIADAIKRGVKSIFVGIGGSATIDGGMGMLEALRYCYQS